jgi:hypothetical protein
LFAHLSFGRQPIFVFVPGLKMPSLRSKIRGLGDQLSQFSGRNDALGKA